MYSMEDIPLMESLSRPEEPFSFSYRFNLDRVIPQAVITETPLMPCLG